AIACQGSASSSAFFQLGADTFLLNTAVGGNGSDGSGSGSVNRGDGGTAEGGSVWIDAGFAAHPIFAVTTDAFSLCDALGGNGGSGVGGLDRVGGSGGRGGRAS